MTSIPWDQSADFLAASNTDIVQGGPTTYGNLECTRRGQELANFLQVYPRRVGNSPQDVTSFHPGQALWSKMNLPDIMYVLKPSKEWTKFTYSPKPKKKRDEAGKIVWEAEPDQGKRARALLDFKVLPDKIGTNEEYVCVQPNTKGQITNLHQVLLRNLETSGWSNPLGCE